MESKFNESSQNQPNQEENENEQEELQNNEVSQENIEYAVQLYKKFLAKKMSENIKGQEDNQKQELVGLSLNLSHVSDQAETPQFGTQIDHFNLPEPQINRQQLNSIQNRLFEHTLELNNKNNEASVNQIEVHTLSQLKRIKFLPLYEIDHSKQFFSICPDLSALLKKYKDFVKSYSLGEISALNFKEGFQLNNQVTLNGQELKQLAKAIFRNVFRRMEQYILNISKKNIVSISEEDILLLSQLLLNETNLDQDYSGILKRFMKISFDIPAQITENQIINLYSFMMQYLNQKNTSHAYQIDFNWNDSKARFVWNREKQIKFCQDYQAKKSLKLVLEIMNKESIQPKVSLLDLRYKLEQLIKQTIKKLQMQYKKYQNDQYRIPLMCNDIKAIVRDIKALPLRVLLLKTNIKKYVFLQDIRKIITAIDTYLKAKNKQKESNKINLSNSNKKRITSDDSSSENKSQDLQSSSSEESEEQLNSNKNNKIKVNTVENLSGPKYYQQTLFNIYQKNSQSSKGQRKIIPSISSSSFKKGSQFEKLIPKIKSKIRQK